MLEASYSDLASSSTVLSTDPSISIDCVRIYLTYPPDPTSSAFPTAPHKASCNTLELLTASAGRLANVTLTFDVINILPEGKGVGSYVGSGEGDAVGVNVGALVGFGVGSGVGWCVGLAVGHAVGSGDGSDVGEGVGDSVGDGVGAKLTDLTPIKSTFCSVWMLPV